MTLIAVLIFYLFVGHALMDFALQGDAMASCKCRGSKHPAANVPWFYWLVFHALLHGGMVAVTFEYLGFARHTAVWFGIAEAAIHTAIDYAKCEKWFGIHVDQGLHLACKVVWAVLATQVAFG